MPGGWRCSTVLQTFEGVSVLIGDPEVSTFNSMVTLLIIFLVDTILISNIALRKHPNPHYMFQLPWLSCLNIDPDELHIVYLGVAMYLLGSVLWLLCYDVLPGSPQDNMSVVWTHFLVVSCLRTYSTPSVETLARVVHWKGGYSCR